MCFTMGRIVTIGTFMEQISDVYRHHRHQRISSVAAPITSAISETVTASLRLRSQGLAFGLRNEEVQHSIRCDDETCRSGCFRDGPSRAPRRVALKEVTRRNC